MLGNTPCFRLPRTHSSSVSSTCLLASTQTTLRGLALYVSCGTLFHSCDQAFRHVDDLFSTTCFPTMFAVYLLSDLDGQPTAFPLSGPQCTVGGLARTHWGALQCPGSLASGTKRQPLSAALLHRCCIGEPVLTRATKHKEKKKNEQKKEKQKKGKKGGKKGRKRLNKG